jgi:photosystem II stability/assembly factor-like uncharacterized protein
MNTLHNKGSKMKILLLVCAVLFSGTVLHAKKKAKEIDKDSLLNSQLLSGLKFRSIGPATTSGRIADFAVNPDNHSEYYVAIGSGNIFKTINNGTTWQAVFEKYGSYSIGVIEMDPNNSNVLWTGTGENNHQRALGYGDGVYKTMDGGKTWKNMGLKDSRHIGGIVIDPRNSDIVFVAAEGSAWGSGGDRGLYKTTDGGKNWKKVLHISENTGVNNVIIDPVDPDVMYATSEQRRRHVYAKIGGGPESAIYKSTDRGENWRKLTSGLPSGHVGGMGIDISPVNHNYIYAIIEAEGKTGGFFRSTDRGESWVKMSDHSSSGQYYNEIYCDPVDVDKVYSVETLTHFTEDGGKTWKKLGRKNRHVDDHALWIDPQDTKHFIIGGDGGVYESFDGGATYLFKCNLSVTQFYRVQVDNAEPFYNVYGGTQDNNTLEGPSRNFSKQGVTNAEWEPILGGDGFWAQIDPNDPNIVYCEYQYGNSFRYDKQSGERISIKPREKKGELAYKWNWNAPLILSKHKGSRIFAAANKLFRSNDRGNSWQAVSEDLTRGKDRDSFKVMGKYWSADAVKKHVSTSQYGTIVSLEESPVQENLLYVGTDDGLIQISEKEMQWHKVANFPNVPEYTYVSDILASKFDANVVFVAFDNRKRDDFKPYLLKSIDKGKTWVNIAGNLPENGTVHAIEQDFKNPDLLFVGTEFGIFFTHNGGKKWIQLKAGIPTIAVRDLTIQEREGDLVAASFGRGFYILDDYSPLRKVNSSFIQQKAELFPVKDALMYIEKGGKGSMGATYFTAPNPEFGAVFTYYLKEVPQTEKQIRKEKEKKLFKAGEYIPQPSWKELEEEAKEITPYLLFTIKDKEGSVIRKISSKAKKGINRVNWDLSFPSIYPQETKKFNPVSKQESGMLAMPGSYEVEMGIVSKGKYELLATPVEFNCVTINNRSLPAKNRAELVAFQQKVSKMMKAVQGSMKMSANYRKKLVSIRSTLLVSPQGNMELDAKVAELMKELDAIHFLFNGLEAKASWEEIPPAAIPIGVRLRNIVWGQWVSTSAPTQTMQEQFEILEEEFPIALKRLRNFAEQMKAFEKQLDDMDVSWTPGRIPIYNPE